MNSHLIFLIFTVTSRTVTCLFSGNSLSFRAGPASSFITTTHPLDLFSKFLYHLLTSGTLITPSTCSAIIAGGRLITLLTARDEVLRVLASASQVILETQLTINHVLSVLRYSALLKMLPSLLLKNKLLVEERRCRLGYLAD